MYDKEIRLARDITLGYMYFMDTSHPLASKQGRVYHHRHVASLKIGRWLSRNECVHHLDGDRCNNHPDNLVIMSWSKHAVEHHPYTLPIVMCKQCGKPFRQRKATSKYCSLSCMGTHARRFEISREELKSLVWSKPTVKIAAEFGVSDAAVAKRCKCLGITKPSRGHWAKRKAHLFPQHPLGHP